MVHTSALLQVSVKESGNLSQLLLRSAREWECKYQASSLHGRQQLVCLWNTVIAWLCAPSYLQSHHSNMNEYRGSVCFCKVDLKSETKHAFSFFQGFFFFPRYPPTHTHTYLRSLKWKRKHDFLMKRCQLWSSHGFSSHLMWCGLWALGLHVQKNSAMREHPNHQLLPQKCFW